MGVHFRKPAFAGMFYPGTAEDTRGELVRCFASAQPAADADGEPDADIARSQGGRSAREMPFALIAPHAGYSFSGGIAAHAYARVPASAGEPRTLVVLLGPSHRVYFEGLAGARYTEWGTPLGDVAAANELYAGLPCASSAAADAAHADEHSLEVQLPFLQNVLAPGFRILPLLVGQLTARQAEEYAGALMGLTALPETRTLFVCSTDLSHDHPYARAKAMDGRLAELVASLEAERFYEEARTRRVEACGMHALLLTLFLARLAGREKAEITALSNSGDVVGDSRSRIVGYFSALIA